VIVPTFNRAALVGRAIRSILTQTYENYELIVVDDGSTDSTIAVLTTFGNPKVRCIRHSTNRGVTAAKNTGLNAMAGDWFTFLDSDDEIEPHALEVLLEIPLKKDPSVNRVFCNAMDMSSGRMSGIGLSRDKYVGLDEMIGAMRGEFWGIIRGDILQGDRFNELLPGYEGILWAKLAERSKGFYLHRSLRRYHTKGPDRLSRVRFDLEGELCTQRVLLNEEEWLDQLRRFSPHGYMKQCTRGFLVALAMGDFKLADEWRGRSLLEGRMRWVSAFFRLLRLGGPRAAQMLIKTYQSVKPRFSNTMSRTVSHE